MGYYYRSFTKTANEKRQVESSKEVEHPIKIRSRRNVYRLNLVKGTKDKMPITSSLGSVICSRMGLKSWKNYRKKQWKMIKLTIQKTPRKTK